MYKSKLTNGQVLDLILHFIMDLTATEAAKLSGLSFKACNRFYCKLRMRVSNLCSSDLAINENTLFSFFIAIYGDILDCSSDDILGVGVNGDLVHVYFLPFCYSYKYLRLIRSGQSITTTSIRLQKWSLLMDFDNPPDLFQQRTGIEFWHYARNRLARKRGIRTRSIYPHLKESQFRFNNRKKDIFEILVKNLKNNPLSDREPIP